MVVDVLIVVAIAIVIICCLLGSTTQEETKKVEQIDKINCHDYLVMKEGPEKDHLRFLIGDYCLHNNEGVLAFYRSQNYDTDKAIATTYRSYLAELAALRCAQIKYPEEKWQFVDDTHGYFYLTNSCQRCQADLINIYNETMEVKSYGLGNDGATIFSAYDNLESIYSHTFHNATFVAIVDVREKKIAFFDRDYFLNNSEVVEVNKGSNKVLIKGLEILQFPSQFIN